jgi:hypothetical protein
MLPTHVDIATRADRRSLCSRFGAAVLAVKTQGLKTHPGYLGTGGKRLDGRGSTLGLGVW